MKNLIVESRLTDFEQKYNKIIPKTIKQKLIDGDPSGNHKYIDWMGKMFLLDKETLDQIIESVKKFHSLLPYIPNRDINQYNNLKEINQTISVAYEKHLEKVREGRDYKKLYESPNYLIVQPLTHPGSCKYGAGSKWCTTTRDDDTHFKSYGTGSQMLLYILDKNSTPYNHETGVGDKFYKVAFNYNKKGINAGGFEHIFNPLPYYNITGYDAPDKTINVIKYLYERPELYELFNINLTLKDKIKNDIPLEDNEIKDMVKFNNLTKFIQNLSTNENLPSESIIDDNILGTDFNYLEIVNNPDDGKYINSNTLAYCPTNKSFYVCLEDDDWETKFSGLSDEDRYYYNITQSSYGHDYDVGDRKGEFNYIGGYLSPETITNYRILLGLLNVKNEDPLETNNITEFLENIFPTGEPEKIVNSMIDDCISSLEYGLSESKKEDVTETFDEEYPFEIVYNSNDIVVKIPHTMLISKIVESGIENFSEMLENDSFIPNINLESAYNDSYNVSDNYRQQIDNGFNKGIEKLLEFLEENPEYLVDSTEFFDTLNKLGFTPKQSVWGDRGKYIKVQPNGETIVIIDYNIEKDKIKVKVTPQENKTSNSYNTRLTKKTKEILKNKYNIDPELIRIKIDINDTTNPIDINVGDYEFYEILEKQFNVPDISNILTNIENEINKELIKIEDLNKIEHYRIVNLQELISLVTNYRLFENNVLSLCGIKRRIII